MKNLKSLIYAAVLVLASALFANTASAQLTAQATLPSGYRPEFGTMWTFDAPPLDYWKTRYGFTPDQAWLDHVRLSSIRLPNCSASFVSSDGLVMTNHHCGRACTAAASPADTDYMKTGFVAPTVANEKKCPMLYVDQLVGIEDVTGRIQTAVTATAAAEQVKQRDATITSIEQQCSTGGIRCQVVALYQGGIYSLYKYRRYSDLRLVFAPEEAIAFFGGDPDNFTYPRYDIDVTLLRVYENGQPFHPQDYLKWSAGGAGEGELVFVVGNPGGTGRLNTVSQMEYLRDVQYPGQLAQFKRSIAIYQNLSAQSVAQSRQYNNALFGAQNSFKAITGYNAGLTNERYMTAKRAFEKDFRARIAKDPRLAAQYGGTWTAISAAEDSLRKVAVMARYYPLGGSTLTSIAAALVRLPGEEALPDSLRLPGYRGAAITRFKTQLQGNIPIDSAFDRANLIAWLTAAQQQLGPNDPVLLSVLAGRTPEQAATAMFASTQLGNPAFRAALVNGGQAAVQQSTDPLIMLARKVEPYSLPVATKVARWNDVISANAEKVGRAIYAAYGKSLPPDATFTLRISDGIVAGYPYNGTLAPYKTTFYGMFGHSADFDNKAPFDLPQRWLSRKSSVNLATPLDFVSTNDIIGGNSGSPVINRNGEVVGLVFDGNIESVSNRFFFSDDVMRAVSVHSMAIPEAIRNVFGAAALADELEGKKR
jgi:hypothetical protein